MNNTTQFEAGKNCNADALQVGEYMSRNRYYIVKKITGNEVTVANEDDFEFRISKEIVEHEMNSASQYTEEILCTQTELIAVFQHIKQDVFTVCFNKKPKETESKKAFDEAIENVEGLLFKELQGLMSGGDLTNVSLSVIENLTIADFGKDDIKNIINQKIKDAVSDKMSKFMNSYEKKSKELKKEAKKELANHLKGEERILIGKKYASELDVRNITESLMSTKIDRGYSMVVDLEAKDDRPRQVRHDGIQWFIWKGVKYSRK